MANESADPHTVAHLDPLDTESGDLQVIIETPKGSRNKFKYDEQHSLFKLVTLGMPATVSLPLPPGDRR